MPSPQCPANKQPFLALIFFEEQGYFTYMAFHAPYTSKGVSVEGGGLYGGAWWNFFFEKYLRAKKKWKLRVRVLEMPLFLFYHWQASHTFSYKFAFIENILSKRKKYYEKGPQCHAVPALRSTAGCTWILTSIIVLPEMETTLPFQKFLLQCRKWLFGIFLDKWKWLIPSPPKYICRSYRPKYMLSVAFLNWFLQGP